ncbi:MAG TPA: DNA-3-methyladenine glycosylase [Aeromicrobium sp.]|nr:DNA-3-methyladenine glycosylase [Aeromicrobium sp.]
MAEVTALARGLLGQVLHGHQVSVRITEVEAYGGINDPASHAFSRTTRSEIMYGPPWRLYVYRIHGHHCANVVTGPTDEAAAVLIRAGEVVSGFEAARERRGPVADAVLARGPGNLAKSLGITTADLGTDLLDSAGIHLGERTEVEEIVSGPRVGVRLAADLPFRFWIANEPSVSAYRRHPKAESQADSI